MSPTPAETLSQAMHDLVRDLDPIAVDGVVAGSARRGKRRRRRRRIVEVAGSTAAVVLIGAAGSHAFGRGGDSGRDTDPAGTPTPPISVSDPNSSYHAAGIELVKELQALAPRTKISGVFDSGPVPFEPESASADLGDVTAKGFQSVSVTLGKFTPRQPLTLVGCDPVTDFPDGRCTQQTLSDGSYLVLDQGSAGTASQELSVTLDLPDGTLITASTSGSALTLDQMISLAENAAWPKLAPTVQSLQPSVDPDPATADLAAKLKPLLPAGVTMDGTGLNPTGHDLSVYLDDGHGKVLISISVDPRDPGNALRWDAPEKGTGSVLSCDTNVSPVPQGYQCSSTRLPDASALQVEGGIVVPLAKAPNPMAGVWEWEAHLLTKSDTTVDVVETNTAGGPRGPVTRVAPLLTPAQLKAIATSPVWNVYK